jgi:very-short-patch-repair endonuclease
MKTTKITKNDSLLENAKYLRRNMTPQEKRLWYDFLQNCPIKIYRQRIIEDYIVDFYCHKARLVIEIDGGNHFSPEGKHYDKVRDEALRRLDLHILRFSNNQVDTEFDTVCQIIDEFVKRNLEE